MERFHTELIYWGIMVVVFMFFRNVVPVITLLILIAGVFYAARFFKKIHYPSSGIAYFMIPATQLEKLVVGIVITSFYYFVMMMVVYVIGNLFGTFLNNILASINVFGFNFFSHSHLQWKLFENIDFLDPHDTMKFIRYPVLYFTIFLYTQSLYLLGSIYFKSNQFIKTFLSVKIIGLLLLILYVIELRLIFGDINTFANIKFPANWDAILYYVMQTTLALSSLFFWIVSYFRLTEKQI
jgi:hypothetical protein